MGVGHRPCLFRIEADQLVVLHRQKFRFRHPAIKIVPDFRIGMAREVQVADEDLPTGVADGLDTGVAA